MELMELLGVAVSAVFALMGIILTYLAIVRRPVDKAKLYMRLDDVFDKLNKVEDDLNDMDDRVKDVENQTDWPEEEIKKFPPPDSLEEMG